jgi:hypothetical protein
MDKRIGAPRSEEPGTADFYGDGAPDTLGTRSALGLSSRTFLAT